MTDAGLPKRLNNCAIVDSIVEVRFISDLSGQAIFSQVYGKLMHKFPEVEALPVFQIPAFLADVNLQHSAAYKIKGNGYIVSLGAKVVSIAPVLPYPGWDESFFPTIKLVLDAVYETAIIKSVTRLGARYINFFPAEDIFPKVNVEIKLNGEAVSYVKTSLRTFVKVNDFSSQVQISNDSLRQEGPNVPPVHGSMIDIDVSKEYAAALSKEQLLDDIQEGHIIEKTIFWDTLSPSFQKELDPVF